MCFIYIFFFILLHLLHSIYGFPDDMELLFVSLWQASNGWTVGIDYCFNALFGFDVLSALQLISLSGGFLIFFHKHGYCLSSFLFWLHIN